MRGEGKAGGGGQPARQRGGGERREFANNQIPMAWIAVSPGGSGGGEGERERGKAAAEIMGDLARATRFKQPQQKEEKAEGGQ